ncbi:short-chain dehydrogenase [Amycolatopsis sp. K13G38]|uniref:Short-chain dehydrogenase n=1 Tax=Amycolatopsis acididurans TaxID=2724524 RepID=A0ABX1IZ77_9PSEU|nr:short-chain dehydrogenase [Amycolatopsis acididurans]NKQ52818.1 short-chain dehydrogenase [Amycolatopsis acididurans]
MRKHTIVMTGASRGIGRVAADILRREPDVHLVEISRGSSGFHADLGSLERIRSVAAGIRDRLERGVLPPLRAFAGNAGVQLTNAMTEGPDGFEATFAVNVLANHLLVRLLQDRFTTPGRIVITTSDTHFGDLRHNLGMVPAPAWRAPAVLARPGAFPRPHTAAAGRTAYSTSKLATIHLVHEYARRLPSGLDAIAYNPAFVPGTALARDAGPVSRFAMRRILPAMTLTPFATTRRAAGRHLAEVVLGRIAAPTGSYVDRGRVARSSAESYAPERERELWETLEELTAAHRPPR